MRETTPRTQINIRTRKGVAALGKAIQKHVGAGPFFNKILEMLQRDISAFEEMGAYDALEREALIKTYKQYEDLPPLDRHRAQTIALMQVVLGGDNDAGRTECDEEAFGRLLETINHPDHERALKTILARLKVWQDLFAVPAVILAGSHGEPRNYEKYTVTRKPPRERPKLRTFGRDG